MNVVGRLVLTHMMFRLLLFLSDVQARVTELLRPYYCTVLEREVGATVAMPADKMLDPVLDFGKGVKGVRRVLKDSSLQNKKKKKN